MTSTHALHCARSLRVRTQVGPGRQEKAGTGLRREDQESTVLKGNTGDSFGGPGKKSFLITEGLRQRENENYGGGWDQMGGA